jgi:hypothetical protein
MACVPIATREARAYLLGFVLLCILFSWSDDLGKGF